MKRIALILAFIPHCLWAMINFDQMISDLETVHWIDHVLEQPLPTHYNYIFSTGYFVTPSARMSCPGMVGAGYSYLNPYRYYNLLAQPFSHLELSMNWRIFKGIEDPGLSHLGFGDFADRSANVKLALFTPEESGYSLPGFAVGIEDFMGSKRFTNYFAVATYVAQPLNLELSLGWGAGRFQNGPSRGFFAGCSWYPWFHTSRPLIGGLAFSGEYDPIDYTQELCEPHPLARSTSFPVNLGIQYNYNNLFNLSVSSWRGQSIAVTTSCSYNWGSSKGFFPKIYDPPFYSSPIPSDFSTDEICGAFKEQGLFVKDGYLIEDLIILRIENRRWIREADMRSHVAHLLLHFPYSDVKRFIVILESHHLDCQSYYFCRSWLESYCRDEMGQCEFDLLTQRKEPIQPLIERASQLYSSPNYTSTPRFSPRFETFFGSAKGKFKYDLGAQCEIEGTLPFSIYYEAKCSATIFSTLNDVADFDRYNPSQLPNVATDYINYRNRSNFSTDKLYLQTTALFSHGFFSRLAAGYFQVNYAGVAGELLWYPAQSNLAIGLEGALLKKRSYHGLGFQSKLRILDGFTATYRPYTILNQYFLDLYWDSPSYSLFTKLSVGGFLAHDKGGRLEVTRYFQSGLRLTGWLSFTDAGDRMHSVRYFDRGIAVEMPLEIFYTKSCRRMLSYGLGAWLRDAGYRSRTGYSLFEILNPERRY